jgi:dihydrolipoamide dehydrogenase
MVVGDVTTAVDILILGGGPAGYTTAIRAAQLGRKVTLIEAGKPGGICLNTGCIPLKALLTASERYSQAQPAQLAPLGIAAEAVSFDWASMQAWKQSVSERLVDGLKKLLAGNKVEIVSGMGWFINEREVRVEGEHGSLRFKFEHCVIATGARAVPLPDLPFDDVSVLTPEAALALPALPKEIHIFGENYLALELATLFARLNVQVKLFTPGEQLLAGVDPVALRLVQAGLRKLGVQITPRAQASALGGRPLVVCNGVQPNTAQLRLPAAGVQLNEHGGIAVNTMQQSSNPAILAVGDCTGGSSLAGVAFKQGKVAAEVIVGQRVQFAPLVEPLVVHTTPELATVGYSAAQAEQAGYQVTTGRFPLAANGRALTLNADNGVALMVANAADGVLLGATLVGPRAGDLIEQLALAIEMGATLTDLSEILYPHPALGELVLESAESALSRVIHILQKS